MSKSCLFFWTGDVSALALEGALSLKMTFFQVVLRATPLFVKEVGFGRW